MVIMIIEIIMIIIIIITTENIIIIIEITMKIDIKIIMKKKEIKMILFIIIEETMKIIL